MGSKKNVSMIYRLTIIKNNPRIRLLNRVATNVNGVYELTQHLTDLSWDEVISLVDKLEETGFIRHDGPFDGPKNYTIVAKVKKSHAPSN